MMEYRTRPGDMLDAICHRYYAGRPGATELVLEANPGLARLGPVLPEGVTVTLPDFPPPVDSGQIMLWE
ncbi:phage tail protein [Pseudomonas aeruginosa]|nr:phage tail protein [Pseudomonas aeruginosa]